MAAYFDPTDPADLALLPVAVRTSKDLEDQAPQAEQDVINHYTRHFHDSRYTVLQPVAGPPIGFAMRPTFVFTPRGFATDIGGGALVYLIGYTQDSTDAQCDPGLRKALKRAIARTLAWRLYQLQREPGVQSEGGQGGRTRTYRANADSLFPKDLEYHLKTYDSRPPNWAV